MEFQVNFASPVLPPPDAAADPLGDDLAALIGRYDHVTRLPNRLRFLDDYARLRGEGHGRALLMVTLAEARHYNEILRALGHAFADEFVRQGAETVRRALPRQAALYHVSVLSFAIAIDHQGGDDVVPEVAREIARICGDELSVDRIPIKTRIGIGLMPLLPDLEPAEALRAALAAAQDSRRGEWPWAWYDHRTDAAHMRAFRLLSDLPRALLGDDELSLHLQPRLSLRDGRCIGAEALIRWTHPELGPVGPAEFVPLAEQTALIGPLTEWVLDRAVQLHDRIGLRGRGLILSVNASPANLSEPGFDERLIARCAAHGLPMDRLEVEFTEGTLAGNLQRATTQLRRLRAAGIHVAIDDFGSGFANLNYLTSIPADVVKIDQSFIRPLADGRGSPYLVRQIVEMARGLDFRVCAEGIETAGIYGQLRELGCDEGQGYFIARPMPVPAFADWLATP